MSKSIELSKGFSTVVSEEDYYYLSQWSWYVIEKGRTRYAVRNSSGRPKRIYMHREIMKCTPSEVVDHINHDGLDNTRSNLRLCNKSQNGMNSKKKHGKQKYKGVYKSNEPGRVKRYKAYINVNKRRINLGVYMTAEEAASAYNQAAIKFHGEFACLNQ